jgi:putative MATE family efflux protein
LSAVDTTRGDLLRASLKIAWPAVLQALLINCYAFNDFLFVGMLGDPSATAALSACFALLIGCGTLVSVLPVGAMALIAQRVGAADTPRAAHLLRQALVASVSWALVFGVLGQLAMPAIVDALNVTPAVAVHIRDYMGVLFWGMGMFALMRVVTGAFHACGATRVPLVLEIFSLLLNTLLNWLLVIGPGALPSLGVTGAAIATAISRGLPGALGLYLIARGALSWPLRPPIPGLTHWIPRAPDLAAMARIGGYESMAGMMYAVVYLVLNRMAGLLGPAAQGGLGAGLRGIEWLGFAFGDGFLTASVAIVGQNIGAGQWERARRGAWICALLAACCCQLVGVAFLLAPDQLSGLVTDDATTLGYTARYVFIVGWIMWAVGLEMSMYGAFVGAGRTHITLWVSGVNNMLRVPIAAFGLFGLNGLVQGSLWSLGLASAPPPVTGVFDALAIAICLTAVFKAIVYCAYLIRPNALAPRG